MQKIKIHDPEMESVLSRLQVCSVTTIERIGGGRNSRVYRLNCESSNQYAAKLYFRHSLEERDRLEVEFSGLKFLWKNGLRCIPQPVKAYKDCGCAIYEYIDGRKIASQDVVGHDIDEAVRFLIRLKELKNRKGSTSLPAASEACFSLQAIIQNIEQRLSRLSSLHSSEAQYLALRKFLVYEFIPFFEVIKKWCRSGKSREFFASELTFEEITLSPSDFGFHNALRRKDGKIVFLDFEYFGWDDPAKMISDFLLHPAMDLRENLKQRFVTKMLSGFEEHMHLAKRIESVYPLFGLKWCLILLNEFVPENLLRRGFASCSNIDKGNLQSVQLLKANQMLNRIINEHEHFPYCI